jgi:hypothetical protein
MTHPTTLGTLRTAGLALAAAGLLLSALAAGPLQAAEKKDENADGLGYTTTGLVPGQKWHVHDRNRPHPPVEAPPAPSEAEFAKPPAGAVVLFDGTNLDKWFTRKKGKVLPAAWKVENGYMECAKGAGTIYTKEKFGDCRLHVEWMAPSPPKGHSQGRGNSGVFFCDGKYEVQVLDSYQNKTYADGQAAAIYGQHPPRVNVCRPPGQWQTYDILWRAPRFKDGKLERPATITVRHNTVLVQDNWEVLGETFHKRPAAYRPHPPEGSIVLQDHGNPIRFRNIWLVPLKGEAE